MRSKEARAEYERQIDLLQRFIEDPWPRQNATVQVMVPKVFRSPASAPPQHPPAALGGDYKAEGEAALAAASAQRVSLQIRAAPTSVAAEVYARKFEFGDLSASVKDNAEEENHSNAKEMCRLCFSAENEGTERARKMLPCNSCGKKYHGNCLKIWFQNRDLFHWSLWTCFSCRICEVCHQTGDQNNLMFCKRCDDAFHCFCLQHPHKDLSHGPFLCPKHTRCHSCHSTVPGNGISVRWYLGYTCCDACGRLFVKGNYCPVCLKVYRDSESTPMVCCDICERWVHCPCDGISDEKYMQFQVDVNLQYVCPVCRGECRQVRDLEEAVEELWRMRDEVDKHEIATLREAAGLPTHEEIFQISPFSDDDEIEPSTGEYSCSLKLPLKGFREKSPKKSKEYGKMASNTKYGKKKSSLFGPSTANKNEEIQFYGEPNSLTSPAAGSLTGGMPSINEAGPPLKHKIFSKVLTIRRDNASITIKTKSAENCGLSNREDVGNNTSMSKPEKGPKLVIHLGGQSRNITSPPRSKASSFRKGKDSSDDVKDMAHLKVHEYFDKAEIKSGDHKGCKVDDAYQVNELGSPINAHSSLGKRSIEDVLSDFPTNGRSKYSKLKYGEDGPFMLGDLMDDKNTMPSISESLPKDHTMPSISESLPKDQKSLLKFKIPKKSNNGDQAIESLPWKDIKTFAKGQRSKRRQPAKSEERALIGGADNTPQQYEDDAIEGADNTQKQYEGDPIEGAANTQQQYEGDPIEGADNAQQRYEDDTVEGADNAQQRYEDDTIEGADNAQQWYEGDTIEGADNTQQLFEGDTIEAADNTQQRYEGDTIEGADNTQQRYEGDTIEGADNTQQRYEGDTIEGADSTQQQYEGDTIEGADSTQQQYEGETIEGADSIQQQNEGNTIECGDNTQRQHEGHTVARADNTQQQYEDDTIEGADNSPQQYEDDRIEGADDSAQQYEDDKIEGADHTQQHYQDDTGAAANSTQQQYEDDTIEAADNTPHLYEDDITNDLLDATWILPRLGKDAAGKKVEVHQPSNNSWHGGTVVEVIKGGSFVSVALDDGRVEEFEFEKQRIRFVPPNQKH